VPIEAVARRAKSISDIYRNHRTFVIDRAGIVQQVFMAQEALDPAHALEACAVLKEVK